MCKKGVKVVWEKELGKRMPEEWWYSISITGMYLSLYLHNDECERNAQKFLLLKIYFEKLGNTTGASLK